LIFSRSPGVAIEALALVAKGFAIKTTQFMMTGENGMRKDALRIILALLIALVYEIAIPLNLEAG